MSRFFALLLTVVMTVAALGTAHAKEGMDDFPTSIVLAREGPSLYDPYAAQESDYPDAIPVRLLRGNPLERQLDLLRAALSTVAPESVLRPHIDVFAASQQSFYHRQQVLRI